MASVVPQYRPIDYDRWSRRYRPGQQQQQQQTQLRPVKATSQQQQRKRLQSPQPTPTQQPQQLPQPPSRPIEDAAANSSQPVSARRKAVASATVRNDEATADREADLGEQQVQQELQEQPMQDAAEIDDESRESGFLSALGIEYRPARFTRRQQTRQQQQQQQQQFRSSSSSSTTCIYVSRDAASRHLARAEDAFATAAPGSGGGGAAGSSWVARAVLVARFNRLGLVSDDEPHHQQQQQQRRLQQPSYAVAAASVRQRKWKLDELEARQRAVKNRVS